MMPESSWSIKSNNSYGSYEKAPQKQIGRRGAREDSTKSTRGSEGRAAPSSHYIKGVAPLCYTSLDSCMSATNSCSGHGDCYKKTNGTDTTAACFACQCKVQHETKTSKGGKTYRTTTHWGGGACQKEDVSVPFWLISGFTVIMVTLISWGIGLLYSVGEEKLPGVIGAGVSSKAS